jgi:hypothetical protein
MNQATIKLLVVNDDDMNCDIAKDTIESMNLGNVGFSSMVLDKYDMIVYVGAKGSKILKSKYTPLGLITKKKKGVGN